MWIPVTDVLASDAIVKEGERLAPLVTADCAVRDVQTVPH
jgi:hypothetical protein